jgi:hypothetical protein
MTINVLDGNDAPTGLRIVMNGALLTVVDENTPIGTVLGTLSGVDQDCCDTYRYTMVDASRTFTLQTLVNGSVVLATTQNIDFESRSLYNFSVVVEDDRGLAYRGYYPISVRDINEVGRGSGSAWHRTVCGVWVAKGVRGERGWLGLCPCVWPSR